MECVAALTRTSGSITVCATIHSPSPQTFSLFGRVIILLRGRMVYFGDNGGLRTCCAALLMVFLQATPQHCQWINP